MKIMVFGTFDMIHAGHEDFFRQAIRHGDGQDRLIVSVARDEVVRRVKGRWPRNNENQRMLLLQKHELVTDVVLGDKEGYLEHISAAAPDIIALGYDQEGEYVNNLESGLASKGLSIKIVRLEPYMPETYKTSKLH